MLLRQRFSVDPSTASIGRLYPYPLEDFGFDSDRQSVIHSKAFHKLQYKTQVFANPVCDYYRNRLTHSVEVASLSRLLSIRLGLCMELTEVIGLAHDLGHAPFGHSGEEALNECMKEYGGFSHNTHALKIITQLENSNAYYPGLNLSWEVLEGIVKHNGPITAPCSYIVQYNQLHNLDLVRFSSAEAQLAAVSDDITYICHDIEDALHAELIDFEQLSAVDALHDMVEYVVQMREQKDLSKNQMIYLLKNRLLEELCDDLIANTEKNIELFKPLSINDVRNLGRALVSFSDDCWSSIRDIKKFLHDNSYQSPKVALLLNQCKEIVARLFNLYLNDIPQKCLERMQRDDIYQQQEIAVVVSDYIAGMTDRFAIHEYQKYFNDLTTESLRFHA